MSDYPMLISNKLHSFRNFWLQSYKKRCVSEGLIYVKLAKKPAFATLILSAPSQ